MSPLWKNGQKMCIHVRISQHLRPPKVVHVGYELVLGGEQFELHPSREVNVLSSVRKEGSKKASGTRR